MRSRPLLLAVTIASLAISVGQLVGADLGRAAPTFREDVAQALRPATDPAKEARLAWFREAKYGLFIHWGLYAIPAGQWQGKRSLGLGEWIMNRSTIPVRDYEQLASRFNPVKFNADEWV
jgi:hypothetical protein